MYRAIERMLSIMKMIVIEYIMALMPVDRSSRALKVLYKYFVIWQYFRVR